LICPSTTFSSNPSHFTDLPTTNTYIRSGLGYDRVTRQIRFPVLSSNNPVSSVSQAFQTAHYTEVTQYLSAVYAEQSAYNGGLYILADNFVNQFASVFSDYTINLAVSQKLYNYYATQVPNYTPIPEFLEILQSIPAYYDPADEALTTTWQQIIEIFGTEVTISTSHGGVFFQQTAVKQCYGGNISPDQESEITTTINNQASGNLAYLDYRRLGLFDVKGGNPEIPISNRAGIIASFPTYPAITSFTSIPLWKVAPTAYQAPLQAAINAYTASSQATINSLTATIAAQRTQSYKNPQNVYVYGQQTEQYGDTIIHWTNCPYISAGGGYYTPRCTISVQTTSYASGGQSEFISVNWYNEGELSYYTQRDPASGDARLEGIFAPFFSKEELLNQVSYQLESLQNADAFSNCTSDSLQNSVVVSAWQNTGCVSLDYIYLTADPNFKVYFTACIDCLPVVVTSNAQFGLKDSDLQCVCQGF